jgi:hypothetical protein
MFQKETGKTSSIVCHPEERRVQGTTATSVWP